MDFTRERNDDLMRAYREQLALANYIIMPEIFEKVAESPAERFWVSPCLLRLSYPAFRGRQERP